MRGFLLLGGAVSIVGALAAPRTAQAYPTYIRLGYLSCTSCHVSPEGGGILNEYGKGIGGSEALFPMDYKTPSFMEPLSFGGKVNNSLEARGLVYTTSSSDPTAQSSTEAFLMQADYMNSTQITDAFRLDLTVGLMPTNELGSNSPNQDGTLGPDLVLRKALLNYRPYDGLEVAAGRDYLPVGLNVDDHTTFLRSLNRDDEFDYFTQARLDIWQKDWLLTPYFYGPSFEENANNREYGGGFRVEHALTDNKTVGLSGLYGSSPSINRLIVAPFARVTFTERLGVLAEYNWDHRTIEPQSVSFDQNVVYARPFWVPLEGIELGFLGEYLYTTAPFYDSAFSYGPDAYVTIIRNFTVLLDARLTSRTAVTEGLFSAQLIALL